ncbi:MULTISPECIES: transglutaminase family protein [unclassified Leptolyngbya]|uniref:transglutaminase family protein n=1 Tax=unclassified Leptolyngbya TaxID=2650499 RepID=UPI0016887435|nr:MULTISPECIES: transglutaminase family protein [unclassified Leptolyngbya]MBD1911867.1 transglutaminase family protein [Leptolyngbya sp. FACHB-8]MBD2156076.1 transglutaminase family protein [Leptolyngbya sp. FACHB-16]
MAVIYDLEHITTYRYANPVTFGEHRAIFLPSLGYAGRTLSYSLETNIPAKTRWLMDTLSNNVAVLEFSEPATELQVTCRVRGEHHGIRAIDDFPLETRAEEVPVQYTPDEWVDLSAFMRPHAEDPDGSLAAWSKSFVAGDQDDTLDVLQRMMDAINETLTYQTREVEGTQSPSETLRLKSGTCRDYAWLMIESLRRLGFACRFVSGYLYDAALDGGEVGMTGSGATHAWLQVYLPGAGWRAYDPTNRITAGYDLIRVAIARHPAQVIPLAGSWFGNTEDYLGMDVKVTIRKLGTIPDFDAL